MNKRKKYRILLISDHFYPEQFLCNEIPAFMRDKGFNVDVLTQNAAYPEGMIFKGEHNPIFRITRMNGIRIFRVKTITGYGDSIIKKILNYIWFMLASLLWAFLTGFYYEYIFVYHVGTLTEALPLFIYKRIFGKRTSIWTQDIWPDSVFSFGFRHTLIRLKLLECFVSIVYNSIDSIMVSSPGFVEKISKYVPIYRKPKFIPQWAPNELFIKESSSIIFDKGSFNFVFAGNIGTQQNIERVIYAFKIIHEKYSNACFHIVGGGSCLKEIKDLASSLNMDYIFFHSRIPQSQILSLLCSADSCVLSLKPNPTIELTLPAKFQTYLFAERPILCVARGEAKALVSLYGIGEIAEPDSTESISEAISRILEYSPTQKKEIAEKMHLLAFSLFNENESKRKLLEGIVGYTITGDQ